MRTAVFSPAFSAGKGSFAPVKPRYAQLLEYFRSAAAAESPPENGSRSVVCGELSESEKEYDRNTAFETLRMIVKLGYKITKDK